MNDLLMLLIVLAIVLGSGLGVIYSKHESRRLSIELQALQVQENELEIELQLLQLEQSTLSADAKVDQVARTQLQMISPRPDEIKYIALPRAVASLAAPGDRQ